MESTSSYRNLGSLKAQKAEKYIFKVKIKQKILAIVKETCKFLDNEFHLSNIEKTKNANLINQDCSHHQINTTDLVKDRLMYMMKGKQILS